MFRRAPADGEARGAIHSLEMKPGKHRVDAPPWKTFNDLFGGVDGPRGSFKPPFKLVS